MPSLWNKIVSHSIAASLGAGLLSYYKWSLQKIGNNKDEEHDNDKLTTVTMKLNDFSPSIPITIFRPNKNLEIAFDTRTRNPVYVLEHLKRNHKNNNTEEGSRKKYNYRFTEETSLAPEFRSRNGHYRNSGYDRGHLAPAADFAIGDERNDTFTLTNASPQVASMNRKIWANLEAFVRSIAARVANDEEQHPALDTYVVTGPLWIPIKQITQQEFQYGYNGIGIPPSLVSVPTHFFKVVVMYCPEQKAIAKFAAFVVPNTENETSNKDFTQYLVRWTDLEAVAGMHFFPSLVDDTFKKTADTLTEVMWNRDDSIAKEKMPMLLLPSSNASNSIGTKKTYQKPKEKSRKLAKLQHICQDGCCTR